MSSQLTSLVKLYGQRRQGHCGYCDGKNGSKINWGMWAFRLQPEHYENLIDRGWRRSGSYCYKPIMAETCCPAYTIRCNATQFRPSRHQKRLLNQVAHYLNTGVKPKCRSSGASRGAQASGGDCCPSNLDMPAPPGPSCQGDVLLITDSDKKLSASSVKEDVALTDSKDGEDTDSNNISIASQTNQSNAFRNQNSHSPSQTCERKMGKSKLKRWLRKQEKMRLQAEKKNVPYTEILQAYVARREARLKKFAGKSLKDYLAKVLPSDKVKHRLEIRLVRSCPASDEFEATKKLEHSLYQRYQSHVHKDDPDDVGMNQFTRFLINSPLIVSDLSKVEGSYHQQYWLDDKLIAVGVVDILATCLSSVYLFYDPDFDFLSLGTYTALREIDFVDQLSVANPAFQFYYMGYYIHSCPKMRYKGQYRPSFLACPETFRWQSIVDCRPRLDVAKYSRLDSDTTAKDTALPPSDPSELNRMIKYAVSDSQALPLVLVQSQLSSRSNELGKIAEWARLVGVKCAREMVIAV